MKINRIFALKFSALDLSVVDLKFLWAKSTLKRDCATSEEVNTDVQRSVFKASIIYISSSYIKYVHRNRRNNAWSENILCYNTSSWVAYSIDRWTDIYQGLHFCVFGEIYLFCLPNKILHFSKDILCSNSI